MVLHVHLRTIGFALFVRGTCLTKQLRDVLGLGATVVEAFLARFGVRCNVTDFLRFL